MGLLAPVDARIVDRFFHWRHALGWDPPVDQRIVIIELDNATFDAIGQPVSRWADDYANVVEKLLAAGADIVALDILFSPQLSKLPEADAEKVYTEIEALAAIALSQNLVLIDSYQQSTEGALTSVDILHAAADSQGNIGYNNLLTDRDGIVRSLGLFFYTEEPERIRNFVGRIAELATKKPIVRRGEEVDGLALDVPSKLRINYPGPPSECFTRIKMSSILDGHPPDLKGKICLLGPAYDSSNDLHNTPHNIALGTWGIEIHAAALNTILTQRFLLETGAWSQFVFTFVGVFLAFLIATKAPTQTLLAGGILILSVFFGFAFVLFAKWGILCPMTGPALASVLSGSLTALARYRALEHSRRYVESVLGRFVSPQVMEELLSSPDNLQLGGRRKRITVLFTDINNFTPLCEKRSPEEVITMLNDFFNEMLEIIFRYDGTVKQFVGDEIMVMYGAPNDMQDHARRAVLTARDMVVRLQELKALHGDKPGFYDVKVGIHSGNVVVGNIGNEKRSEYAAVGDPVNTTARIEGLTKALDETILVSEETVKEIGDSLSDITFVSKGHQSFKGKADQMEVFGVRWNSTSAESS